MRGSSIGSRERRPVRIQVEGATLEGDLAMPEGAQRLVLFVHGSGSSRHSPRNQLVAASLREVGIGTLLFDLLTEVEEKVDRVSRHLRFDIDFLARRVIEVIDWIMKENALGTLPMGLFGASTGAAAALVAAAERPECALVIVSRGGRPDLAGDRLPEVKAPTLLIVGGDDLPVIELNRQAFARLTSERKLEIVPGAGHLFDEPGTLEQASGLARDWFVRHLSPVFHDPDACDPTGG